MFFEVQVKAFFTNTMRKYYYTYTTLVTPCDQEQLITLFTNIVYNATIAI